MLAPQWPEGAIFQSLLLQPGLQFLALWASLYQRKQAEHQRCKTIPAIFCFTTVSYKWKNFCSKQPELLYYLFIFLYNTPEHSLKLPPTSTSLMVLFFFFLLGNIVYSVIQFYCLCLGISQNECWWNSQLIRDEQTFRKSWTKEWLFPTSLTSTN